MAGRIGPSIVIVHPPPPGRPLARWATGTLKEARAQGVSVAIENMPRGRAKRLFSIRRRICHKPEYLFGIGDDVTLDISHVAASGLDFTDAYDELVDQLRHIRLSDSGLSGGDQRTSWFGALGRGNQSPKLRQDAVGEAPDHVAVFIGKGGPASREVGNLNGFGHESVYWSPKRLGHFLGVETAGLGVYGDHDGRDDELPGYPPGTDVVETAQKPTLVEVYTDLLKCLAAGGVVGIFIARLPTAAGERHVSRPRVLFLLGAFDHE